MGEGLRRGCGSIGPGTAQPTPTFSGLQVLWWRERRWCHLLGAVTLCRPWLLVPLRAFNWASVRRMDSMPGRTEDSTS